MSTDLLDMDYRETEIRVLSNHKSFNQNNKTSCKKCGHVFNSITFSMLYGVVSNLCINCTNKEVAKSSF